MKLPLPVKGFNLFIYFFCFGFNTFVCRTDGTSKLFRIQYLVLVLDEGLTCQMIKCNNELLKFKYKVELAILKTKNIFSADAMKQNKSVMIEKGIPSTKRTNMSFIE